MYTPLRPKKKTSVSGRRCVGGETGVRLEVTSLFLRNNMISCLIDPPPSYLSYEETARKALG